MAFVIRQVQNDFDYQSITRLRYDVYVEEMGKNPDGADHVNRTVSDALDRRSVIFGAFDQTSALATGRITPVVALGPDSPWRQFYQVGMFPVPEQKQVIYGKLMVRGECRGTMVIPHILIKAYEQIRTTGTELGFLHCAPSLVPLYEVMGCRRYKKGEIDPEVGFRLPMVQLLGDEQFFGRVKSPLLRSVKKFPSNSELAEWFETELPQYSHPASVRMMNEYEFLKTLSKHVNHEDSPLFVGLTHEEIQKFIHASAVFDVATNDVLLRQDDVGTEMYVVLSGAVEISRNIDRIRRVRATLGYGQFVGEGGFLLGQPRSADVTAIAPTKLLSLSAENFEKIRQNSPELSAKVLLNLCRALCQRLYVER